MYCTKWDHTTHPLSLLNKKLPWIFCSCYFLPSTTLAYINFFLKIPEKINRNRPTGSICDIFFPEDPKISMDYKNHLLAGNYTWAESLKSCHSHLISQFWYSHWRQRSLATLPLVKTNFMFYLRNNKMIFLRFLIILKQ